MKEKYKILIPNNSLFKIYEEKIKKLYEINRIKIGDYNDFDFIKNNTLFYVFLYQGNLLGSIYYYKKNGKLFINAFANKGFLPEKLECLKISLTWFRCDIYAVAKNRASALCILRCGFKKQKNNIYKYNQTKNGSLTSGRGKDVF